MRPFALNLMFLLILMMLAMPPHSSAAETGNNHPIALVIHGGAGIVSRADVAPADEAKIRADLDRALDAGYAVLNAGGTAMDAAQAAIVVMEDSPFFNAGKGSVFDAEGGHELDASIMEGHTGRAGAVAGVFTIKNPIKLARAVMEHSPHVMLVAQGAERFADTQPQIERVDPKYFDTEKRWQQLQDAKAHEKAEATSTVPGTYFGTVGAVALDRDGHIAAGTSTGGMTNKRYGRVGDSPIIGAGTYATETCGVSGTGWGEFYIRAVAAHDICARVAYRGDTLAAAAEEVINKTVPAMGGDGGAIALDNNGVIAMPFNTTGMYRGWIRPDGSRGTAIFADGAEDSDVAQSSSKRSTPSH
jgi:beta-aspartyl-peptidase (threonine type)